MINNGMNETQSFEQIVLSKLDYYIQAAVPANIPNARLDVQLSMTANHLITSMQTTIFGVVRENITISYPKTWWDAVKKRFAPYWFLKKWPVEMVEHTFAAHEIVPTLKIQGHESRVITFYKSRGFVSSLRGLDD